MPGRLKNDFIGTFPTRDEIECQVVPELYVVNEAFKPLHGVLILICDWGREKNRGAVQIAAIFFCRGSVFFIRPRLYCESDSAGLVFMEVITVSRHTLGCEACAVL